MRDYSPAIKEFAGIYEDRFPEKRWYYLVCENLETRSKEFNWVIKPHFHPDLYQFFYLKTGSAQILSECSHKTIHSPGIFMVPPLSVHGLHYEPGSTGKILTLSEVFLEPLIQQFPVLSIRFQSLQWVSLDGREENQIGVDRLFQEIQNEIYKKSALGEELLNLYIKEFAIKLYRILGFESFGQEKETHSSLLYYSRFKRSIRQSSYPKSIPEFSRELSISPVHLNRICQALTQKSASQIIQDFLSLQAENYLLYTDFTIKEIAYKLKFEYPGYFARWFKKQSGMSPREFRSKNNKEDRGDPNEILPEG